MITLTEANEALHLAGFSVQIDNDTDGFVEIIASKGGLSETFFDTSSRECHQYLGCFNSVERLVAYAEKSIDILKRQSK